MKKKLTLLLLLLISVLLVACGESTSQSESASQTSENRESESDIKTIDGRALSSIEDCKKNYDDQITELKNDEKMSDYFEKAEFGKIDYINTLNILKYDNDADLMSVEESIKQFELEIEKQGKTDLIDLKKELRDCSDVCADKEDYSLPYPYFRPSVYENYDRFTTGSYFFITTDWLHIQMMPGGFYSFSDTVIKNYVGSTKNSALDGLGASFEHIVVEEGKVEDLKDKKWRLMNGEVSVGDAAEMTRKFFEAGTPYPPYEGVTINIPYVRVIEAKDIYMYEFAVQRCYEGIPVAWKDNYSFRKVTNRTVREDSRTAYTISGDKVNAYFGVIASLTMKKTMEDSSEMLNVKDASELLIDKLAPKLSPQITNVCFEYVQAFELEGNGDTTRLEPCWIYDGTCRTDGKKFRACVNALTGDAYAYLEKNLD